MSVYERIMDITFLNTMKKVAVIALFTVIGSWLSIGTCQAIYSTPVNENQVKTGDLLVRGVVALEKLVVIEENE